MPEEEGQQQAAAEPQEAINPYVGKYGLFIIIIGQLLAGLLFTVYIHLSDPKKDTSVQGDETEAQGEDLRYFNQYMVRLDDLNYSLQMPGGNTATMSMAIDIVLGRTPEERQNEKEPSDADMNAFKSAVTLMDSEIRDRLRVQVSQQSISQLNSPGGQDKIREYVKEFVNNRLRTLNLDLEDDDLAHERVTNVFIRDIYIQQ